MPPASSDPELRKLAAQAKRRRRLILAIVAGNALVAIVLVGGPYLRGRRRALAGREAFGRLVACLWGGELVSDPGLALPPGEELAYIDAFRAAPPEWPMHCADELEAASPDPVFWLFPDTRHAEGEVRRAARMVRGELEKAEGADRAGTVPSRPRLAVQRLQAALTLWSREADVYLGLEEPLIAVPDVRARQPERVPLRAAEDAVIWMEPRGDGLEIRAIDARGISWVRVGGGRVDMRRLRKPGLVKAFGASERWPLLVWATPDERCAPECARQASGVAWLTDATAVTPDPVWIAAHPAGPAGTHVRALADGTVVVIAAAPAGAVAAVEAVDDGDGDGQSTAGAAVAPRELRRFPALLAARAEPDETDAETEEPDGEPAATLPAETTPLAPTGEAVVLPDGRPIVVDASGLVMDRSWVASRVGGRVALSRDGVSVGATADGGGTLRLAGDDDGAALVFQRDDGALAVRCDPTGCAVLGELEGARRARVARLGDAVVVAYDRETDPQIRVARWDAEGELTDGPAPAACTSDEGGFCGPPVLGAHSGRLALGARDGSDLWVLESTDGARWRPLRGLR